MALSAERLLRPLFPPDGHEDGKNDHTYGEDEGTPGVKVVLADYQGWWAPLTHLFYSNASRSLVSAHPESSLEEVESFYCTNCLNYFAEAEAAASSHRCPQCFDCPQCKSALVIMPVAADKGEEGKSGETNSDGGSGYAFRCGYCLWSSSKTLGLVETKPEDLAKRVMEAKASPQDVRFRSLVSQLRERAVEVARDRHFRGRRFIHMGGEEKAGGNGGGGRRWHLEDLEKKEAQQAAQTTEVAQDVKRTAVLYSMVEQEEEQDKGKGSDSNSSIDSKSGGNRSYSLSAEEHDSVPPSLPSLTSLNGITTAEQRQHACSSHQPSSTSSLIPMRRLLTSKRSRRCRVDVEEGRPGILLKPKVNPLEGDSSMRSHVGKWWQKDASAVHVLPFVSVVQARGLECVFHGGGEGGEEGREEGEGGGGREEEEGGEGSSSRGKPSPLSFVLRLRNSLNGKVRIALVPPPTPPLEGSSSSSTMPYYLRHLSVALGSSFSSSSSSRSSSSSGTCSSSRTRDCSFGDDNINMNVLYAYVPALGREDGREQGRVEEGEELELEACEDEYLEDEKVDEDQDTLDMLALQMLERQELEESNNNSSSTSSSTSSSSSSSSSSKMLLQRKSRAWLHVVVRPPSSPLSVVGEAAVGVLLFLRLTSDRSEFSSTRGETASIVVPVCLAFTRGSTENTPEGDFVGHLTRLGLE